MAIRFTLSLPKDKPAHITIEKFVELIKNDEFLLPETRAILESLKKARQPYVPLPLVHEVIISPEFTCTLHKDLNPPSKIYTKMLWTSNNKLEYDTDSEKFYLSIIQLYNKLGFDVERYDGYSIDKVEEIIKDLDKKAEKALKKFKKLKQNE